MRKISDYLGKVLFAMFFAITISAINVTAATFTVSNTNNSGAGSLRQAILDSNSSVGSDTIVFDSSFNAPQTIVLASVITFNPANSADSVTITGPGANLLTIDGNNVVRILHIETGDQMSVSGITFTRSATGAAIVNEGSLTVADAAFTFNNGGGFLGGAITHDTGSTTLSVTNSTFISNTAGYGGAIGSNGLTVTVTNCTFTENTAVSGSATGQGGGAIHQNSASGTTTITNSTFTANAETGGSGGGGALRNRSGTMNVVNSIFTRNTGMDGGGAIQGGGVTNITGSTFTGNSASGPNAQQSGQGSGGAISNQGGAQTTIADSVIIGNSAVNHGGGIYYQPNSGGASITITNTTIANNVANTNNDVQGDGGGIYLTGPGVVTVTGSTISGNRTNRNTLTTDLRFAGHGGGIWVENALKLDNSTVSGNVAELDGGGIYDGYPGGSNSQVVITSSTFVNNRAGGNGGGIRSSNSVGDTPTNISNTIVAKNTAGNTGNDIFNNIISGGFNLISVDPLLGPLNFNGGPTRTHALLNGSPAIDAGDPATFPATDQRGVARPQDGNGDSTARPDIGAYERRVNDVLSNNRVDFDGDGKTDISIYRESVGEWWYSRSSDVQTRAAQFGVSTDKPMPADYTGDGRADIAFWRPATGEWFILRSEDGSYLSFPFGQNGDLPVVGDFDGDGKADPGVFRAATSTWYIQSSTRGTIIATFGGTGDVPVTADYDGDGKTDIAIYRPAVGEWWVLRSSNASYYAFQFGAAADKPVQGDYTGDGKADPAFFRPSTGEWFILRSEDSSFYSVPFGANVDKPAPGDYDGDGRYDTAVFRTTTGVWYVDRSSAGVLIAGFGFGTDQPIPGLFVP
ncbi:MAG TPA: choice-of-anchor Q domain-containing protein [Pyrinomonadaceae bacterium]|jgi:hypothetical protein